MRRTYRSKKDTDGCLDHKDVLLSMDIKSSIFNAFYIQSIKQTKKELSTVGASKHFNNNPNKIRKRKYVKRLMKDVEPPHCDYASRSTDLTPDKSIHVNKAPDLFDQLLNSGSGGNTKYNNDKKDPFDDLLQNRETGTYSSKNVSNIRRFNYSSTDYSSDSDKENTENNENESDVGSHKLSVEIEPKLNTKNDDSVYKLVNDVSFINKLKSMNSSKNNSLKSNKSILKKRYTNIIQSPILGNSPLSSTPFATKYRMKSIYKFSPIAVDNLKDSAHATPVLKENKNDSDVHVIKTNSKESEDHESQSSPIFHLYTKKNQASVTKKLFTSALNNIDAIEVENMLENTPNGKFSAIKNDEIEASNINDIYEFIYNEPLNESNRNVADESIENKDVRNCSSLVRFSSKDSTIPSQLFLGFSEAEVSKSKCKNYNLQISNYNETCDHNKEDDVSDQIHDESNLDFDMKSIIETTIPSQPFLGFSKVQMSYIDVSSESESSKTSQNNYSKSERESLYDTCDSEGSSLDSASVKVLIKEPLVRIEKMNSSLFQKYYDKMADYASQDESITKSSSDNAGLESKESPDSSFQSVNMDSEVYSNSSDIKTIDPTLNISEEMFSDYSNSIDKEQSKESPDSSFKSINMDSEEYSNSSDIKTSNPTLNISEEISSDCSHCRDKEQSIMFVTIRRKNYAKSNDLEIYSDFYENHSNNCDEIVLNKEIINKELDSHKSINENEHLNFKTNDDDEMESVISTNSICSDLKERQPSFITMKKSVRLTEIKDNRDIPESQISPVSSTNNRLSLCNGNPGIVLQPGKKWERSLSIYKRMTMMSDQFNSSILENEPMHIKGRNYRQSVISTMEMQNPQASLHNEIIYSRRSTFVSKPNRSTIRILKDSNNSRVSLCSTSTIEDLNGFLNDDCDDTIVELSRLSIVDDHEVTVLEKVHDTSGRAVTAKDHVLRRCNQTEPILFDEYYPDTVLKNCRKIGEGVYGEVFLWRARDGIARVMKVIPIAGTTKVNGEDQKDFHEIISEIVIAMELSALRAPIAEINQHFEEGKDVDTLDLQSIEYATDVFNEVVAVRCVYGPYPSRLVDLWELWDESRGSDNDNPAALPADQHYVVLELANAGADLESYVFNSAEQAYALLIQVAFGLAVAEEAFQFEHRDLHWGNILVAPTDQKWATFVLRGRRRRVARRGVAAAVIDYSLSRLALPRAAGGALLYNDLAADGTLFDALGDYQFDVYRLMRDKLRNDWKNFEPYTNILWLHYTVDKMITALRYKRTNTRVHKQYITKLKGIKDRILCYGSAAQFVLTDNELN